MAFIAPLVGAAVGGGLLGSIASTAVGIGINLAIAYFFPQKIKGPRAESLKAQTSRYGEQLARWHGAIRTAGAVIWLKGDHVDEHVKTERQGKALGPEVTTYSYTATFAVAFAWNGPATGVTRIWADDKLIYDVSADALQYAIDHGGKGVGVAQGATVTVYLGTDDQESDPDIEADRGAGMVPAWPGIVYVVIKNLPLDEFGIRIPNIEAEILKGANRAFLSTSLEPDGNATFLTDIASDVVAIGDYAGEQLFIYAMPAGTLRKTVDLGFGPSGVFISSRNDMLVGNVSADEVYVYDVATGSQRQVITVPRGLPHSSSNCSAEISFGGASYVLMARENKLSLLSNIGSGWTSAIWTNTLSAEPEMLTCGPDRFYWSAGDSNDLHYSSWDSLAGPAVDNTLTPPGFTGTTIVRAIFYDDESDSVIVFSNAGHILVYSADMGTLLRSITDGGWSSNGQPDQLLSRRARGASNTLTFAAPEDNRIVEYRISDLTKLNEYESLSTSSTWGVDTSGHFSGVSADFSVIWQPLEGYLLFLPRAARTPVPLADVLEEECALAGLACDVSHLTHEIMGA